ncbi:hypothetical protein NL676_037802 [Syzygium grande]|nr:hypothetical protein NL676_037802 [Syzygium grande]
MSGAALAGVVAVIMPPSRAGVAAVGVVGGEGKEMRRRRRYSGVLGESFAIDEGFGSTWDLHEPPTPNPTTASAIVAWFPSPVFDATRSWSRGVRLDRV